MFAWFDREETGLWGSHSLVNDYLYKEVLEKYGSQFAGAYIADMVMVSEPEAYTQSLPDYVKIVSKFRFN